MESNNTCTIESVVECFKVLSNPASNSNLHKQADSYLTSCEEKGEQFLFILLTIFESNDTPVVKLQSLICFNNVIKRNWLNKRIKDSTLPNFEKQKAAIKDKMIGYLVNSDKMFRNTILDGIIFIGHNDFPHNFQQLNNYFELMLEQVKDIQFLNQNIKALNQILKRKKDRSSMIGKKHFQDSSIRIIMKAYPLFQSIFTNLEKFGPSEHSLFRSVTKLLLLFLITAPNQMIDNEQLLKLVEAIYSKLQGLITLLSQNYNPQYEKTIRVFIQYISYLQYKHPFSLILCFQKYLQCLLYLIMNHQKFKQKDTIKYTLLSLTKIMKTFVYYSPDQQFQGSSHSRSKAVNFLNFRNQMHALYNQFINEKMIQQILSKIMSEILSLKDETNIEVGFSVEDEEGKIDEKDSSIQKVALNLVEIIITRFPIHSANIISNLVNSCLASNFTNVDKNLKNNILSVCSVLPSALRNVNPSFLSTFPIQTLISYTYNSGQFANKFALLSCKWIHRFSPEQILQIVSALLSYIQNNSENLPILLQCCLAVKTIVLSKSQQINLGNAVQKIIPVAIRLFSNNESVQILWPMITLISKLISSVECNLQTLQNALACNSLISLLQTKQQLIIQALCEMFRNILCTLPRDQSQPITYDLVITFLSNQLMKIHLVAYDQVLKLWYLLLRQYSHIQGRNAEVRSLFDRFFKTALNTLNQRLLYILEQYVLLDLVGLDVGLFSSILSQFYQQTNNWTDEVFKLKITVTSVHITFITKFGIQTVHNNDLLLKYLSDLINPPPPVNKLVDTFKTSILTLVNRYIILFKQPFMQFINSNFSFNEFLRGWFDSMQFLTSRTACKINAIALLYMMPDFDVQLLKNRFATFMKKIIPQFIDSDKDAKLIPKVGVSPTYRLSENILSERKQAIRRQGVFEQMNLKELFVETIKKLMSIHGFDISTVQNLFLGDVPLIQMFYKLIV